MSYHIKLLFAFVKKREKAYLISRRLELKGNASMNNQHSPGRAGNTPADEANGDTLHGATEIGDYLNVGARRAFHLLENGFIPTFKLGARWAARKSRLDQHMADMEDAG